MEHWIFDQRLLQVGLLRINPKAAAKDLPKLSAEFRGWKRVSNHAGRVITFNRNFEHVLLYHRPFIENTFDYDVSNTLRFVGVTHDQFAELEDFMKRMVFRDRTLWVKWTFSSDRRCSFCVGYFRHLKDEDYSLPLEGDWFKVGEYGGGSSKNITREEEQWATSFWKTWRGIDDPRIRPLIRREYKEKSLSSSLDLLNLLTKEISAKCCPPSHHQLSIDLPDLKDSPNAPDIWHIWQNNWHAPKGFDRYALPKNPSEVRAYPIVNVMSSHPSYGLDYALNVVHVRGESFVEVQAYECPELLQMTADVFGAPVDVWEGPLEDRFGWYGDASKGTTRLIEPKTSNAVTSHLETVFVAAPKRMWLCRDGKEREAPEIYQRPVALAASLEALRKAADTDDRKLSPAIAAALRELNVEGGPPSLDLFGDKEPGSLLSGVFDDSEVEETFDWFQYPKEVLARARQLVGLSPDDDFVEQMRKKWRKQPHEIQVELVQLLNLTRYRITELSLSSDDRAKLEKALSSKRVSRATDNWIASLLNQKGEWDITDHHYDPTYETNDGTTFY